MSIVAENPTNDNLDTLIDELYGPRPIWRAAL
jgi:hypothetical protein